jgi:hypothetical protein
VDFFTPLVDDPFTFGLIAATNALSDVYAMGGRPLTALSIVCFPQDGNLEVLEAIMRGGMEKLGEAGCVVLGGHSVRDPEIKFGYAVTGLIHPDKVLTNTGAHEGDHLIFTKAIGTGVITSALKQGKAEPAWVEGAIQSMTTLNRVASEIVAGAAADYGVEVAEAQETIETGLADPRDARLLGVDVGMPLLLLSRHSFDADGMPVEWAQSRYRGDRYKLVTRLHRGTRAPRIGE